MSKGLTTRTIVLLITGLIVLALVLVLIYITQRPTSDTIKFNVCKTKLASWCLTAQEGALWEDTDCAGKSFSGGTFCGGTECKPVGGCSEQGYDYINCCNVL